MVDSNSFLSKIKEIEKKYNLEHYEALQKFMFEGILERISVKKAIENTFSKRDSFEYLKDYEEIIKSIMNSERIKLLWNAYSKKNNYASDIEVNQIMIILKDFIKELNFDLVVV